MPAMKRTRALAAFAALLATLALAACAQPASEQGASSVQSTSASQSAAQSSAPSSASASSEASSETPETPEPALPALIENLAIQWEETGGIRIALPADDLGLYGFSFGDGVNVAFSNGFAFEGVPYYNGEHKLYGDIMLVGHPGDATITLVSASGESPWYWAGVSEADTATISMNQVGAYRGVQEAFSHLYSYERADYGSDEAFANFRMFAAGSMASGLCYRCASPIYNDRGRAAYAAPLLQQAGTAFVLNLSDSLDEASQFIANATAQGVDTSYYESLLASGNVAMPNLSTDYQTREFATSLAPALATMAQHDGPYLVHCIEGKDRTGFVCMLLESLCGASYDEMVADYMVTYDNYYGINPQDKAIAYDTVRTTHIDEMFRYVAGVDDQADLTAIDYAAAARSYLMNAGMTNEQIDALVARLVG